VLRERLAQVIASTRQYTMDAQLSAALPFGIIRTARVDAFSPTWGRVITEADHQYYILDSPTISDIDCDLFVCSRRGHLAWRAAGRTTRYHLAAGYLSAASGLLICRAYWPPGRCAPASGRALPRRRDSQVRLRGHVSKNPAYRWMLLPYIFVPKFEFSLFKVFKPPEGPFEGFLPAVLRDGSPKNHGPWPVCQQASAVMLITLGYNRRQT
jgi:hypothetical protein